MRETFAIVFILLGVISAYAQTDATGGMGASVSPMPPVPVPMPPIPVPYTSSVSAIDQFGNLLVFDTEYSYIVPVPGQPIVPSAPKTRVTVVPVNGQHTPLSKEYAATTFQILGTGQQAVYALAYSYTITNGRLTNTRKLVAINVGPAGVLLPDDGVSGPPFPAASLLPRGDAKLSRGADAHSSDTISSVEPPVNPMSMTPVQRLARIIKFDGIQFSSTDVPLP
jgi:hypothetical protein